MSKIDIIEMQTIDGEHLIDTIKRAEKTYSENNRAIILFEFNGVWLYYYPEMKYEGLRMLFGKIWNKKYKKQIKKEE